MIFFNFRWLVIILLSLLLSACFGGPTVYAPVTDISTIDSVPSNGLHRVSAGETLYSIAWRYGLDYHYLALRNNISPPYSIYSGQVLYLKGKSHLPPATRRKTVSTFADFAPKGAVKRWQWPARGRIVGTFSEFNKGINIQGESGDPVYATANGKVVYSGSGLRGYGNLIIVEHNNTFLTAYAHNSAVFVRAGDWVKTGQKIAEMGKTGARQVMLHFEIRRSGRPVNPLIYLSGR